MDLKLVQVDMKEFKTELYQMYVELFPAKERKPRSLLEKNMKEGIAKIYKIVAKDTVVGFLITNTIKGNSCLQLDYLAISPKYQKKGYGTEAIKILQKQTKDKDGILIEIEKVGLGKTDEENIIREKREKFYKELGFKKLSFDVKLFTVIYSMHWLPCSKAKKSDDKIKKEIYQIYEAVTGKTLASKFCKVL